MKTNFDFHMQFLQKKTENTRGNEVLMDGGFTNETCYHLTFNMMRGLHKKTAFQARFK